MAGLRLFVADLPIASIAEAPPQLTTMTLLQNGNVQTQERYGDQNPARENHLVLQVRS